MPEACSQCGEAFEEGFEVCWKCGTAVDGSPPAEPDEPDPPIESSAIESPATESLELTPAALQHLRRCHRCRAQRVFTGGASGGAQTLPIVAFVDGDPKALVFKNRLCSVTFAEICGACGAVELRCREPEALLKHFVTSLKADREE